MPKKQNRYSNISFCKGLILLCILFAGYLTFAQNPDDFNQPNDSNIYYTEYPKMLALQLFTQSKTNSLSILSPEYTLRLRPNGVTNLGIGANYYGIGLSLALGLPKTSTSENIYGKTKRYDLQLSAYAARFGLDGFIQSYKGYYNANPDDFMDWNNNYYPQIPDLQVISVGASGFYIFNHKKFSYKAAYKHTTVQHKSAGSFVLGVYGYLDKVDSENGLIPAEFPDSIKSAINIKGFTTLSTGISIGYMHNFVIRKKFILNLAALPGTGLQQISLTTLDGKNSISNKFAGQVQGRAALGYDHKSFYLGITSSAMLRTLNYREFNIDLSTEQFRFFIGKRFKL